MSIEGWMDTVEYYTAIKKWNPAICDNVDGSWEYYAKWNKSEKDKYRWFPHAWNIKTIHKTNIEADNRSVVTRGEGD